VRWVLLIAAVLLLGACAGRDPYVYASAVQTSGNWKIERQTDRITGEPIASAFLQTLKSSNTTVAFRRPATLAIGCLKEQPTVRFAFQFKVGSNRNAVLGYRFDEKPGHEIEARFLNDYKNVVIEETPDVALFMSELATSKNLFVRIRSLNAGRTAADFEVTGAPAAIDAIYAQCPIEQQRKHA
jgi:hypothetical protein